MKNFTVVGSFNAECQEMRLPLSFLNQDKVLELADVSLDKGTAEEWPYKKEGAVFYLGEQPIYLYEQLHQELEVLPAGDYLVQIEVLSKSKRIHDEHVSFHIENLAGMDDVVLEGLIQRFLYLDYSGYVPLAQRQQNWSFFDFVYRESSNDLPLSPYRSIVKVEGFIIQFELSCVVRRKFELNVKVDKGSIPQL